MTIERLSKVSLVGPAALRADAFAALQRLGCMHLISPDGAGAAGEPVTAEVVDAIVALRYLRAVRTARRQVPASVDFDFAGTMERVLANRRARRNVLEQIDWLRHRIEELLPWGDFPVVGPDELGGHSLWLLRQTLQQARLLEHADLPWLEVHRDNRFCYTVIVAEQQPAGQAFSGQFVPSGPERLAELEHRLTILELELDDLDAERTALTRWIGLVERDLGRVADQARLAAATEHMYSDLDGLFLVCGWIAEHDRDLLESFAAERGLAIVAEPARADDRPPTLLRNQGIARSGEELLTFYTTPGYGSWDPSPIMAIAFAAFFAMIVADAGYALTLWLALAFFHRRLGATAALRDWRRLAHLGCMLGLGYGIAVGSYWGYSGFPGTSDSAWLASARVIDLADYQTMIRLSVAVGVVHVLAGLAMSALYTPPPGRMQPLGWMAVVVGGLGHWLSGAPLSTNDPWAALVVGGLLLVVAGGGRSPASSIRGLIRRVGEGLLELRNVTQLFGDVMSYLRLFALGLAGTSLAMTFNDLAAQVRDGVAGAGLLLSVVVLVVGHGINLLLAVVGGTVHGLRLNYIEFLHWSVAGDGYPFRPFGAREAV